MSEERVSYSAVEPMTAHDAIARLLERLTPELEQLAAANVKFQVELHCTEGARTYHFKLIKLVSVGN